MSGNRIELSDDHRHLTITGPQGHQATLRSARPGGFSPDDLAKARDFRFNTGMEPNQVNRARRIRIGKRVVYAHFNVGPPTWWLPRIEVKRGRVMAGWLRVLVALSWSVGVLGKEQNQ